LLSHSLGRTMLPVFRMRKFHLVVDRDGCHGFTAAYDISLDDVCASRFSSNCEGSNVCQRMVDE
jgi:hypothetical protein